MASQDWFEKDFYSVLGVDKDVSEADLKKKYRKLAREYHPDSHPGDAAAEAKFKEISEAYSVLSDKQQREEYDQIRAMGQGARFSAGSGGPGGSAGFEDMFGSFFGAQGGGARGGQRTQFSQDDLNDLFGGMFGGAPGPGAGGFRGGFQPGPQRGANQTASTTLAFRTAMRGETVELSKGDGSTIKVRIPAGVADGKKIRLRGKGSPSPNGGEAGDLILEVSVKPDPVFDRDGNNLLINVPVTFVEAVRGATIDVPTLDGTDVHVKVPPFSQSGRTLRVRGRGIKAKSGTGDLLVKLQVSVPQRLTSEQEQALDAFAEASPADNPREDLYRRARG